MKNKGKANEKCNEMYNDSNFSQKIHFILCYLKKN
jgi:hypothetical protein